jgi:hypothetical protein
MSETDSNEKPREEFNRWADAAMGEGMEEQHRRCQNHTFPHNPSETIRT